MTRSCAGGVNPVVSVPQVGFPVFFTGRRSYFSFFSHIVCIQVCFGEAQPTQFLLGAQRNISASLGSFFLQSLHTPGLRSPCSSFSQLSKSSDIWQLSPVCHLGALKTNWITSLSSPSQPEMELEFMEMSDSFLISLCWWSSCLVWVVNIPLIPAWSSREN